MQLAAWGLSLAKRDASVADPVWGLCFVLIAWVAVSRSQSPAAGEWLVAAMVTLWGLRLSGYLIYRNWGHGEDHRYAAMRDKHGGWFPLISLATVFGLQAALAWIIALPLQVGMVEPDAIGPLTLLGAAVWAVGLAVESTADLQLARFKADPSHQGQVMDRGLWRYSRHPNYFGEFVLWWGIYLAAAESGSWWWTIIGPLTISVLLLKVSGVTLLEKSLSQRLDAYGDYARRTSAFVPWPPKNSP
ncbi:DUF1295 domain-containing protein [Posidoniimonas polymericola]|uniref:DUF1295 domain-containing protein n=1 Tax=Posidoniimonas polymericola TaxID=2528002 RepID=UPI001E3FB3AF|nr:DUF1295 domain-containing protein [Posidoniimonas polymericola]